ncbi:MAG TPA: hypothetical protein VK177_14470 [Flavobacteriales bacterium]|nr:hypothetical protein [Flavobacteriales bacterium]
MKRLLVILLLPLTTCFAAVKESDMPYYEVTGVKKNSTLPKNKARIVFHFEEHSGFCLRNLITYKINNVQAADPSLDTLGNYSCNMNAGTYEFEFFATYCNPIKTKKIELKKQTVVNILVHFHSNMGLIEADKPVIYLYPTKETNVSVTLDFKGEMDFSYPVYHTGWNVTAYPGGTLKSGQNEYGYLFYEGKIDLHNLKTNYTQGSVVESSKLISFLESSLASMGLNTKEIADFVTYWAPRMMKNEKNCVHFMLTDAYDQIAGIKVVPTPDNVLRVYMLWDAFDPAHPVLMTKQTFIPIKREGFTVVEWGGSEININPNN